MTRMRSTTPTPSSPAPPPLTPGTLRIERVEAPSLAHFFETYAERQTPVIITNYSHIFSGMSLANIESACGQASVSASRRAEESGNWASLEQCEASRSLAEHMRELSQAAPADGADSVGIFDMPLFSVCPSLLEQHFVMPKYFAQDFMQRVPPRDGPQVPRLVALALHRHERDVRSTEGFHSSPLRSTAPLHRSDPRTTPSFPTGTAACTRTPSARPSGSTSSKAPR